VITFALVVSVGTLVAGIALALALRRLPTVRLQLAALARSSRPESSKRARRRPRRAS